MSEWGTFTLGDLTVNSDSIRKPVKETDRKPGPYPYYGASGIVDHVDAYLFEGLHLLIAEDGENLRTRKSPIAFLANGRFCVNNHAHIVRGNDRADTKFLHYALQVADVASYLSGSTMPKLTQGNLNRIPILAPNIDQQRAIANVLSALDDKIELNRQMNETLERMAQAIFKDWFVDFGPDRRKQARVTEPIAIMGGLVQDPARAAELAAQFPDGFGESGAPEGWCEEPLLKHVHLVSGGTPKTEQVAYWNGEIFWASAKDVSQCRDIFLIETERSITELGLTESSARIIPANATVVVARGATTGRYCLFGRSMAMNQTCYALVSNDDKPFWTYKVFGNIVKELVHAAHGSVFDTITTKTFSQSRILITKAGIEDAYEALAKTLFEQAGINTVQSRTLAETRDYLLPKLLSGEVRVRHAERLVG